MNTYKRFKIARERLYNELDIQSIISLNRISKLIHRARIPNPYKTKKAVRYFKRYVIRERDLELSKPESKEIKQELKDSMLGR